MPLIQTRKKKEGERKKAEKVPQQLGFMGANRSTEIKASGETVQWNFHSNELLF